LVSVDRANAHISRSPVLNMTELCVHAWLARQRPSQRHLSHRPAARGGFVVAGR
jgi:hypothetical protein